jgi:hypothetical protein
MKRAAEAANYHAVGEMDLAITTANGETPTAIKVTTGRGAATTAALTSEDELLIRDPISAYSLQTGDTDNLETLILEIAMCRVAAMNEVTPEGVAAELIDRL